MSRNYNFRIPMDCARFVARERYAWPGGYEAFAITVDGALLCSTCVRDNYRSIVDSTKNEINDGWRITGILLESEFDEETFCDHCGRVLNEND